MIRLAKNIGFCSGVQRAINIVEETLSKNKRKVYSLGPVIHNREVIRRLEEKNLCSINSLADIKDATVILPSHGSPTKDILKIAKKKNLKLIDVTCPYVLLVQRICRGLYRGGFKVIIIGDKKHPEIKALSALAQGAYVIEKPGDVPENKFSYRRIGIISQTTQAKDTFFKIVSGILKKNTLVKEARIFNTICLDTAKRQEEVKKLAAGVDTLLVIGSSNSANTKRLLHIGRKINRHTYLVQTKDAPLKQWLKHSRKVGLISGASTPDWLVKEIIKKINSKEEIKNDRAKK
jgi:4-hydroxy-3-methylbut-2-enyl diphosphate reductase